MADEEMRVETDRREKESYDKPVLSREGKLGDLTSMPPIGTNLPN